MHQGLFIGIDAGGTGTRLLARGHSASSEVRLESSAANFLRQGPDAAGSVVAALIQRALAVRPNCNLLGVCIGMAGAATQRAQDELRQRLTSLLPVLSSIPITVVHDGVTAYEGAFKDGSGLLVIAGTGSIIWGRTEAGVTVRAGGWGYLLGDEGSGHALGIRGLRKVCHSYDAGSDTMLSRLLCDWEGICNASMLRHRVYQEKWPVQRMAPLVLKAADAGDEQAAGIVDEEVEALVTQIANLVQRSAAITPRVALGGGLADSPYYWHAFEHTLGVTLDTWKLYRPEAGALTGALHIARRCT